MSFLSATSHRNPSKTLELSDRSMLRDQDSKERFNFRGKIGEPETDRSRESRNNVGLKPKRAEGDDSDGWEKVKPRKSFGADGAERFQGRMGGDRNREDRRLKDREEREGKDRPRGFDTFTREKDVEHDHEKDARRNGAGRGRNESWFVKDRDTSDAPPTPRDRNSNGDRVVDRNRGWREKDRDDNRGERSDRYERGDRGDRGERGDRRWDRDNRDRDQRQENPQWMAEQSEGPNEAHTQGDFQKWMQRMKEQENDKAAQSATEEAKHDEPSFFGLEKQKVETPLEINNGPDKFFGMWSTPKEELTPDSGLEPKEGLPKAKPAGKASRFTSFFTPQEEPQRRQTEPPPPMPPPLDGNLAAMFASNNNNNDSQNTTQTPAEKAAFAQLLSKLQSQAFGGSASGSTPPANASMQPKPPAPEKQRSDPVPALQPFQQYRPDRQEETRPSTRNSQQSMQDLLTQRQQAGSQGAIRPEQMLQDLVGQRHTMSQPSTRPGQPVTHNPNTDFLMNLMQSAKAAPEAQRTEQMLLRMPMRGPERQMQHQTFDREQEMQREAAAQRERNASQRQARPQAPPGFFDDPAAFQRGPPPQHERQTGNPAQPTQILQRPPPPGLVEMGWDRQQLPPQHRIAQNIAPPPGLANGPSRGMPMPQGIYPPGFPMGGGGGFPPPDVMSGPPRNMQMQPPPGFFNAPPPGFMPPGMSGFQGPDSMPFGSPLYDGRGPPPQGFRRQ